MPTSLCPLPKLPAKIMIIESHSVHKYATQLFAYRIIEMRKKSSL